MNRNVFIVNGFGLILASIMLNFIATRGYGNNLLPQTTPEAITDLIVTFIILTGFVLVTIGRALPKNNP